MSHRLLEVRPLPLYRILVSQTFFFVGSEDGTPLPAAIARPESQGRPLSYAKNLIRRDTMDTQRLSMVIEALSNTAGTPDLQDEDSSVRGARIVDLRRTPSLSRARIVDGPSSATPSSVNSGNSQTAQVPAPMPTAAERLAAFRARPTFKSALPSSPRPAYRANSPTSPARSSPLGVDLGSPAQEQSPLQTQPSFQPQPLISNLQVQSSGSQIQPSSFTPQARTYALPSNVLTPLRGLRNLRIGGPVEQPQNEDTLGSAAFERPRPAPLVFNGGLGSPGVARAI
jgi:hypothetical protein